MSKGIESISDRKVDLVSDISKRIKLLRKTLKLSQSEMAETLGLYQSTIAFIESGKRDISLDVIKMINKKFGVSYAWLLNGEGKLQDKPGKVDDLSDYEASNIFLQQKIDKLQKQMIALTREVIAIKKRIKTE